MSRPPYARKKKRKKKRDHGKSLREREKKSRKKEKGKSREKKTNEKRKKEEKEICDEEYIYICLFVRSSTSLCIKPLLSWVGMCQVK